MINPWFKFFGSEWLTDLKIEELNSDERSCWLTLLCYSSVSSIPGTITLLKEDVLLKKSGVTNYKGSVLSKFKALNMITVTNGKIDIINWHKRQETSLTGYQRLKKHRQNKAENGNDNDVITNDNDDNKNDNARIEENRIEENRIDKNIEPIWQTKDWADERVKFFIDSTNNVIDGKYFYLEIQKFRNYWTEKNPNGKKERWQMERVFDPNRRLSTWMRNFLESASRRKIQGESKYKVAEV